MDNKLLFIIIGIVLIYLIIRYYNLLIYNKNQIENIKGSLDALLKQRIELIPNLVIIVKEYMKYESNLLKEITSLRNLTIKENDLSKN